MKFYKIIIFLFWATFPLSIIAQNLGHILSNLGKAKPVEKIYIHTDRENYVAGETIWFKAYFSSIDNIPSNYSTTLYIELVDNQAKKILRNTFLISDEIAIGQIEIPDTLNEGVFMLRAYTKIALNYPDYLFYKNITVYGKKNNYTINDSSKINIAFFPEGGNLIIGLLNKVAFKITNSTGSPVDTSIFIGNNKNAEINEIKSYHDGMGYFEITPEENQVFYAKLQSFGEKFYLPEPSKKGVTLSLANSKSRKEFKVEQFLEDDNFIASYIIGQMHNTIVFKQILPVNKRIITGTIETKNLPSGILQVTVFNQNDIPLAERIVFIDNNEYSVSTDFAIDTSNNNAKQFSQFFLSFKDSVQGNFSVSVVDADYEPPLRSNNILTWFLLKSNIKGYIHNPSYYFSHKSDSTNKALDLVMLTNGWTRFKWSHILSNTLPISDYKMQSDYITISGKIVKKDSKMPYIDKDVLLLILSDDFTGKQNSSFNIVHTDHVGNFKIDSLVFYGKSKILVSDIKGEGNLIEAIFDSDSVFNDTQAPELQVPFEWQKTKYSQKIPIENLIRQNTRKGITLDPVIVQGRQKTPIEILNDKYTSGPFSRDVPFMHKLDLVNAVETGQTILDYIRGRIAGLEFHIVRDELKLTYRYHRPTTSIYEGNNNNNVVVFLDEVPVADNRIFRELSMNQVAYIKLFPFFVGAPGNKTALVIYTKKDIDIKQDRFTPDFIYYNGYTITKEFYNYKFDNKLDKTKEYNKFTIFWDPSIFISGFNPKIPISFFNNSRTKRFKLIAEGLTNDGRMLMMEKIIE